MKRQGPYGAVADSSMNTYVVASSQRIPPAGVAGSGGEATAEHPYKYSKLEGHWQWDSDRDGQKTSHSSNETPSLAFNQGQGGYGTRSYYYLGQMPDPKLGLENQSSKEARIQPHEEEMEIIYEDNISPLTFEGLERKFLDDIQKLVKEQSEAEDAENSRHKEYQEKLPALRAQQANRREEFLRKESRRRLSQYQQAGLSHYPNSGLLVARGYGDGAVVGAARDVPGAYATNQLESYREQPQHAEGGRTLGANGRVPYPAGRVYNNAGARYYQTDD